MEQIRDASKATTEELKARAYVLRKAEYAGFEARKNLDDIQRELEVIYRELKRRHR